jgi:transposase
MPGPYSADLRARVLAACERAEMSRAAIARQFEVGAATLYTWQRQAREESRAEAKPHAGGPAPKIDATGCGVVRALVEEDDAATLAEYVERYAARTKQRVSVALMCRTLRRLGLTRKKRRSGPRSGRAPTSPPSARPMRSGSAGSTQATSSSSTRAGRPPP